MPKPMPGEPSPVRKLREARELTQAQLAELAGTDGSSVSEIERGRRGVWTAVFARIAAVLDAPVDDLRESHIQWVERRWPSGETSSEAHPLRTHDALDPDVEEEIRRMGLHGDKLLMVRGIVAACGKPETLGRIAMQLRLLLQDDDAMTPELDEALLRLQYTANPEPHESPSSGGTAP